MLTQEQIKHFHDGGYILIPNVLSPEQVQELRAILRPKFKKNEKRLPGDTSVIRFDVYNRYPEVRWLLFHEASMSALRSLLGKNYAVLRDTTAQLNHFGNWHKDTTTQEIFGYGFHKEPDYLMVDVAYYLQDNTDELGGGLDVEPGSHRRPDPFLKLRNKQRNEPVKDFVSIPNKAGDLLIFDFRINHRGSRPQQFAAARKRGKLGLFLACSKNNAHVRAYHEFINRRPDFGYLKNFSHDPELLRQARIAGLNLV